MQTVMAGFKAQVETLAASHGVADFQDFADWARETQPSAIKEAMRIHGMQRSTAAYEPLLRSCMMNLDKRPGGAQAILNANFPDPRCERLPASQRGRGDPDGRCRGARLCVAFSGIVKPRRS